MKLDAFTFWLSQELKIPISINYSGTFKRWSFMDGSGSYKDSPRLEIDSLFTLADYLDKAGLGEIVKINGPYRGTFRHYYKIKNFYIDCTLNYIFTSSKLRNHKYQIVKE